MISVESRILLPCRRSRCVGHPPFLLLCWLTLAACSAESGGAGVLAPDGQMDGRVETDSAESDGAPDVPDAADWGELDLLPLDTGRVPPVDLGADVDPPLPDAQPDVDRRPFRHECVEGDDAPPCNGCLPGTVVPRGWVCIPPGEFWMGSPEGEPGHTPEEALHRVRLTRPFLISSTEVSQSTFMRAANGANPASYRHGDFCDDGPTRCERRPAESLSWYAVLDFANLWSEKDGLERCYGLDSCDLKWPGTDCGEIRVRAASVYDCTGYRLPTEAEWEYAARAGAVAALYGPLEDIAWVASNSGGETHPVGTKAANAWGLHDVLGNVSEFVWDGASPNYGGFGDPAVIEDGDIDPVGPGGDNRFRISRGGSFGTRGPRLAHRRPYLAPDASVSAGFRLVRSLPQ